ncbi:hypothetical protein niasHS_005286 [Heterodera schachtii]|uniref:Lon proteolytic domain-containing protein n=1 Tax=Heterodera schachtii TaxID=97005 RepID=A0ABD2J910_HETSC
MPRQVCVIGLVVLENGDEAKLAGKTQRIIARIAKNQRKRTRLTFVGRFSKETRVTRSALLLKCEEAEKDNSWKTAYEVAKEIYEENYDDDFFESTCIEVIAPPEHEIIYGPSASVAIFTAIYALATGRKVANATTLTGVVQPDKSVARIGGICQKVKAAANSGKKTIVLSQSVRPWRGPLPALSSSPPTPVGPGSIGKSGGHGAARGDGKVARPPSDDMQRRGSRGLGRGQGSDHSFSADVPSHSLIHLDVVVLEVVVTFAVCLLVSWAALWSQRFDPRRP